jgi:hypothetical protein
LKKIGFSWQLSFVTDYGKVLDARWHPVNELLVNAATS